jgi:hypothetical protein
MWAPGVNVNSVGDPSFQQIPVLLQALSILRRKTAKLRRLQFNKCFGLSARVDADIEFSKICVWSDDRNHGQVEEFSTDHIATLVNGGPDGLESSGRKLEAD